MSAALTSNLTQDADANGDRGRYMLWIDGVGAYLVCLGSRMTIGGPSADDSCDLSLLANLSRCHATIVRSGEGYLLEAHGPAKIGGRPVYESALLHNGYDVELGSGVCLRFGLPTVLSATATLNFASNHRPARSIDGVILMKDNCLLGPGHESHVRCRRWQDTAVLFRRDGKFWVKSRMELFVNGRHVQGEAAVEPGDVIAGPEFRFRIEPIGAQSR